MIAKSTRRAPRYKPDNGPLARQQIERIRRLQPRGRMKVKERLF